MSLVDTARLIPFDQQRMHRVRGIICLVRGSLP
jgi:hypothetical protein